MVAPVPKNLVVHVSYASGARGEKVVVDSERALVGSGAHCDVCLPTGLAAVEQLELIVDDAGIHAIAKVSDPPTLLNGSPLRRERVPAEAVIAIGDVQLRFELVEVAARQKKKAMGLGPMGNLCVALMIPVIALLAMDDAEEEADAKPPAQPVLWSKTEAVCDVRDRDAARISGAALASRADGHRERFRYSVREGVQAVAAYEQAAACFTIAGLKDEADDAKAFAKTVRTRVNEEYRGHQIRLEHALAVEELDTAAVEVRVLHAYIEGTPGPYARWLEGVERSLKVKLASIKKNSS